MYKILKRETLVPNTVYLKVEAPEIARKAKPGQFVILRVDEFGERFPLSLTGWDKNEGTLEILFLIMGRSTMKLSALEEGDCIMDVVGPLGRPTEIESYGNTMCVCSTYGVGPTITLVKALKEKGNRVVSVMEAKDEAYLFWEDRLESVSDETHVVLGDGSRGKHKQASQFVKEYLESGNKLDRVFIFGRVFTMIECSEATKPFGVKTIVGLTPIMVDGTGMCGCCRVSVGGETKFACVDGPEFDGHLVDWELLIKRKRAYLIEEARAFDLWQLGNLRRIAVLSELPGRVSVVQKNG
ncbi:MAG: sulfide/dihydroorotate dehydrogenase-like FAD/NAD-binding protein [Dehalococcoidia bacterium]|nr:sulfide/dihydroorotate dehydrogenase-like FAD/NAD-binding protein [Dehalococcoidia bacterium]MDH4300341.1 sulfide/dihydroorotate dehydrogenase-like FAD/NAD-binding protein [Dehalococcoidia bacterium]MDH4366647.1 sulfide/dihydroorotate dehydrogenase-like FAD/NAD-binding protein [Dehalococcoidia bacterium]